MEKNLVLETNWGTDLKEFLVVPLLPQRKILLSLLPRIPLQTCRSSTSYAARSSLHAYTCMHIFFLTHSSTPLS
jgi:hypothetical protein